MSARELPFCIFNKQTLQFHTEKHVWDLGKTKYIHVVM